MVQVPLPSVSENAVGTPLFSAPGTEPRQSAAGSQIVQAGRAMQAAGEGVQAIAVAQQERYAEARLLQADLAVNEALHKHVGGYLQKIGQDAVGNAKKLAFDGLEQDVRGIQDKLETEQLRSAFMQKAAARVQTWQARADDHEYDQTQNFAFAGHTAKAAAAADDAMLSLGTPQFLVHKELMLREVDAGAEIKGAGPEVRQQLRLGATTALHGKIVQDLVAKGQATAAKDYLDGAIEAGEIAPAAQGDMQRLVQKATVDKQSFDAARWSSNLGGTLPEQIERLNQLVEDKSTSLPIEVRDAAEARLRSMEQVDYQSRARVGNETQDAAMAYATLNRVRTFEELPPQMRKALEDSGRAEPFKVYLEQGRQFGTTQRGQEILRRALDTSWLASQDLDVLKADANANLSPDDNGNLLAMWYKSRQQKPPPGVSESLINMTVDRRMRELGYLPINDQPKPEQANRRNWVIESVQRALGTGPVDAKTMDAAIEQALGNTMESPTGKILPESALTPAERSAGSYRTAYGNVPAKQVSEESIKAKLEDIRAVNRARSESNASNPYGPQVPLIPESNEAAVQLLRAEQEDRRVRRERAAKTAGDWLRRNRAEYGKDAWHYLPADLKDELDRTGMGVSVRSDYEYYDRTHDFLGRPIEAWQSDPNSMMHQFSSPWGR